MDPDRWERVKAVYHSALDQDPGERAAFLEHACQDDREILREVESLLGQASGDSFLERPAWQAAEPRGDESGPSNPPGGYEHPAGPRAEDTLTPRHPFLWVVWVVLAGLIAAFGYAAWKMPRDISAFGWWEARRGVVWQVTGVDPAGPAAGKLQPGIYSSAWMAIPASRVTARSSIACSWTSARATGFRSGGAARRRRSRSTRIAPARTLRGSFSISCWA